MLRVSSPWHPPPCRGWYVNKLSCVFQLHAKGWSLFAEPSLYLLHMPHADAADKRATTFAQLKHHLWLHVMGGNAPSKAQSVRAMVSSCALPDNNTGSAVVVT